MDRFRSLLSGFTFAFLAAAVALCPLLCRADEAKTRIVLAGDSTVADGNGWGPGFALCLADNAVCINLARNGRSSRSFRAEGIWQRCLDQQPDYVLIQFGHNDQPGKGPERETDPETSYRQFMTACVDEARAAGAVPVLVTSLSRRRWGDDGHIHSTLTPYVQVVKQIAAEKHVPLVDLQSQSITLYELLGREGCYAFSPKKDGQWDHTHLNGPGSRMIGAIVARELARAVPKLAPHIVCQAPTDADADTADAASTRDGKASFTPIRPKRRCCRRARLRRG